MACNKAHRATVSFLTQAMQNKKVAEQISNMASEISWHQAAKELFKWQWDEITSALYEEAVYAEDIAKLKLNSFVMYSATKSPIYFKWFVDTLAKTTMKWQWEIMSFVKKLWMKEMTPTEKQIFSWVVWRWSNLVDAKYLKSFEQHLNSQVAFDFAVNQLNNWVEALKWSKIANAIWKNWLPWLNKLIHASESTVELERLLKEWGFLNKTGKLKTILDDWKLYTNEADLFKALWKTDTYEWLRNIFMRWLWTIVDMDQITRQKFFNEYKRRMWRQKNFMNGVSTYIRDFDDAVKNLENAYVFSDKTLIKNIDNWLEYAIAIEKLKRYWLELWKKKWVTTVWEIEPENFIKKVKYFIDELRVQYLEYLRLKNINPWIKNEEVQKIFKEKFDSKEWKFYRQSEKWKNAWISSNIKDLVWNISDFKKNEEKIIDILWYWDDLLKQDAYLNKVIKLLEKNTEKMPFVKELWDLKNYVRKWALWKLSVVDKQQLIKKISQWMKEYLMTEAKKSRWVDASRDMFTKIFWAWELQDLKKTVFVDTYREWGDYWKLSWELEKSKYKYRLPLPWMVWKKFSIQDIDSAEKELEWLLKTKNISEITAWDASNTFLKWLLDGSIKDVVIPNFSKLGSFSENIKALMDNVNANRLEDDIVLKFHYPNWYQTFSFWMEWKDFYVMTDKISDLNRARSLWWQIVEEESIAKLWTPDMKAYNMKWKELLKKQYWNDSEQIKKAMKSRFWLDAGTRKDIVKKMQHMESSSAYRFGQEVINMSNEKAILDNMPEWIFKDYIAGQTKRMVDDMRLEWIEINWQPVIDYMKFAVPADKIDEIKTTLLDALYSDSIEAKFSNRQKFLSSVGVFDWGKWMDLSEMWSKYDLYARSIERLEKEWLMMPTAFSYKKAYDWIMYNWETIQNMSRMPAQDVVNIVEWNDEIMNLFKWIIGKNFPAWINQELWSVAALYTDIFKRIHQSMVDSFKKWTDLVWKWAEKEFWWWAMKYTDDLDKTYNAYKSDLTDFSQRLDEVWIEITDDVAKERIWIESILSEYKQLSRKLKDQRDWLKLDDFDWQKKLISETIDLKNTFRTKVNNFNESLIKKYWWLLNTNEIRNEKYWIMLIDLSTDLWWFDAGLNKISWAYQKVFDDLSQDVAKYNEVFPKNREKIIESNIRDLLEKWYYFDRIDWKLQKITIDDVIESMKHKLQKWLSSEIDKIIDSDVSKLPLEKKAMILKILKSADTMTNWYMSDAVKRLRSRLQPELKFFFDWYDEVFVETRTDSLIITDTNFTNWIFLPRFILWNDFLYRMWILDWVKDLWEADIREIDMYLKRKIYEDVSKSVKKQNLTQKKLESIIKNNVDRHLIQGKNILVKIPELDKLKIESFKDWLYSVFKPYMDISNLDIPDAVMSSFQRELQYWKEITKYINDWDKAVMSNIEVRMPTGPRKLSTVAEDNSLSAIEDVNYLDKWNKIEAVLPDWKSLDEYYNDLYDIKSIVKWEEDYEAIISEAFKTADDYTAWYNKIYWWLPAKLWLSSVNSIMKTTPTLDYIRRELLLWAAWDASMASQSLRMLADKWDNQVATFIKRLKWMVWEDWRFLTTVPSWAKDDHIENTLYLVWTYFNRLKDALLNSWVTDEDAINAFNKIHEYLFSVTDAKMLRDKLNVIWDQKFLIMSKAVDKKLMAELQDDKWKLKTTVYDFFRRTFWNELSDSSIKLLYNNIASVSYATKMMKYFTKLTNVFRKISWYTAWAIYSALIQAPAYLYQRWVIDLDRSYKAFDDVAKKLNWWFEQWGEFWVLLKDVFGNFIPWYWEQPFAYIRKSLNNQMIRWEFKYWINQLVDMTFRWTMKAKSMYEAAKKNWFLDLNDLQRFIDTTPEWAYKTSRLNRLKQDASELFMVNTWFGVWVLSQRNAWIFSTLFDYRGSRWLNMVKNLFDTTLWPIVYSAWRFFKDISTWKNFSDAKEWLFKFRANNYEYQQALYSLYKNFYYSNKFRKYNEQQDRQDEPSLWDEIKALLQTAKMFFAPIQALESTAYWRLVSNVRETHDSDKWFWAYKYWVKAVWEIWKQFKVLTKINDAIALYVDSWWDAWEFIKSLSSIFTDGSLWYARYLANEVESPTWYEYMPKPAWYDLSLIVWKWDSPFQEWRYDAMMYSNYLQTKSIEWDWKANVQKLIFSDTIWKIPIIKELNRWMRIDKEWKLEIKYRPKDKMDDEKYMNTIDADDVINKLRRTWNLDFEMMKQNIPIDSYYKIVDKSRDELTFKWEQWWRFVWGWNLDKWISALKTDPEINQNTFVSAFLNDYWTDSNTLERQLQMWNATSQELAEGMALVSMAKKYWATDADVIALSRSLLWYSANTYYDLRIKEEKDYWKQMTWKKQLIEWDITEWKIKEEFLNSRWKYIPVVDSAMWNDIANTYVFEKYPELKDYYYINTETDSLWIKSEEWLLKSKWQQMNLINYFVHRAAATWDWTAFYRKNVFANIWSYLEPNEKAALYLYEEKIIRWSNIARDEQDAMLIWILLSNPDMIEQYDLIKESSPELANEFKNSLFGHLNWIGQLAESLTSDATSPSWKSSVSRWGNIKLEEFESLMKAFKYNMDKNWHKFTTDLNPTKKSNGNIANYGQTVSKPRRDFIIKSAKYAQGTSWWWTAKSEVYMSKWGAWGWTSKWKSTIRKIKPKPAKKSSSRKS